MHRRLMIVASTISVGLIVSLMSLGLGYVLSVNESHRTVENFANGALLDAEAIIDRTVREIGSLAALAGQPCTNWSQESLVLETYSSPYVREFGIADVDGMIYCTNNGPTHFKNSQRAEEFFRDYGIFMTVMENRLRRQESLVVVVPLPGRGSIGAEISPEEFQHPSATRHIGDYSRVLLELQDGKVIPISGDPGRPEDTDKRAGIVKQAPSKNYPMKTVVHADPSFSWSNFQKNLPLIGLSALLAGVGTSLLFFRVTSRQLSLEQSLKRAIRRGGQEFQLHYQPLIDLRSGRCEGVEALIRWRHPTRGLIRPDNFIPMAETTGLIVPLTRWLIHKAVDELAPYLHGDSHFHVGINLSGVHFRSLELVEDLRELIASTSLRPSQIMLEATEREILADSDDTPTKVMEMLSAQGFHIAIDDFGTGHNGLAFLQKFPAHVLKIDRTFVDTVGTDAVKRPVLDTIIELGQRLKMGLVAEGVETPEQAAYLRNKGVQTAQGFHFSKPLPAEELHVFMADLARSLRARTLDEADNVRPLFHHAEAEGTSGMA